METCAKQGFLPDTSRKALHSFFGGKPMDTTIAGASGMKLEVGYGNNNA